MVSRSLFYGKQKLKKVAISAAWPLEADHPACNSSRLQSRGRAAGFAAPKYIIISLPHFSEIGQYTAELLWFDKFCRSVLPRADLQCHFARDVWIKPHRIWRRYLHCVPKKWRQNSNHYNYGISYQN